MDWIAPETAAAIGKGCAAVVATAAVFGLYTVLRFLYALDHDNQED